MSERYTRQMLVPGIGQAGQDKLARSRVLVIGLGGLGCPVAEYLAGAGVGTLGLMDADIVALDNLHRQPLYSEADIGRPKVAAAAQRLRAVNSTVQVERHGFAFDHDSASLIMGYDLILDCVDGFNTKLAINRVAKRAKKPSVFAAASQFDGQTAIFTGRADSPCLACLYPQSPVSTLIADCNAAGVLGPMVGWVASLQAMLALQILAWDDFSSATLHLFDGRSGRVQTRQTLQAATCSVCHPEFAVMEILEITAGQLADMLAAGTDWQFCDARSRDEFAASHLPGAIHTPHDRFDSWPTIPRSFQPVFYCASGIRSRAAAQAFKKQFPDSKPIVIIEKYLNIDKVYKFHLSRKSTA